MMAKTPRHTIKRSVGNHREPDVRTQLTMKQLVGRGYITLAKAAAMLGVGTNERVNEMLAKWYPGPERWDSIRVDKTCKQPDLIFGGVKTRGGTWMLPVTEVQQIVERRTSRRRGAA